MLYKALTVKGQKSSSNHCQDGVGRTDTGEVGQVPFTALILSTLYGSTPLLGEKAHLLFCTIGVNHSWREAIYVVVKNYNKEAYLNLSLYLKGLETLLIFLSSISFDIR